MSAELKQQIEALEAENQTLREQLAQRNRVATRALANYQQRALHMEIIRQQNEDTSRLTQELSQARQLAEARARESETIAKQLAEANKGLEKEAEERESLLIQVRRLAAIVEHHPDLIGVGTLEGQVVYVNPAGLRLMGLEPDDDISQMQTADFYPADDAQRLQQEGIPAALAQGFWSSSASLLTTDGRTIPVDQTIAVNFNAQGQPNSFSLTMRDVTERQQAEAEREQLLADVQAAYNQYVRREWGKFLDRRQQNQREVEHRRKIVDDVGEMAGRRLTFETDIKLRGQSLGILSLEDIDAERNLSDEEMALIETVSQQLAQTAENLRLFDETQQRASREQTIRQVTDKLRAAPNLDRLLEIATMEISQLFPVAHAELSLNIEKPTDHGLAESNGTSDNHKALKA